MTDAQFLRFETFGRRARKGQPSYRCIADIVAEAARLRGNCSHVKFVRAETIYGDPASAAGLAIAQAECALDKRGCRLRVDAAALVSGVASYPTPAAEIMNDPDNYETYVSWRDVTIEWMKIRFGDTLKAIIEHRDEEHFHVHMIIVPPLIDNKLDFSTAHVGIAAQEKAAPKDRTRAYIAAMKALLDDFHREVSANFAIERVGPRRKRIGRESAMMAQRVRASEKAAREIIQNAEMRAGHVQMRIEQKEMELERNVHETEQTAQKLLKDAEAEAAYLRLQVEEELKRLAQKTDELQVAWQSLEKRDAQNVTKFKDAARMLAEQRELQNLQERQLAQAAASVDARAMTLKRLLQHAWAQQQLVFESAEAEIAWHEEKLAAARIKQSLHAGAGTLPRSKAI